MVFPMGHPGAMACIAGGSDFPNLKGTVKFYQMRCNVLIVAEVQGLPPSDSGFFALHIHEGDRCTGTDFADTGAHYNPGNALHPRHAGDLPPLLSQNGRAFLAVETDRFSIRDVIRRTVVIHDGPDDFRTQPAGNAGRKIACGIICCV